MPIFKNTRAKRPPRRPLAQMPMLVSRGPLTTRARLKEAGAACLDDLGCRRCPPAESPQDTLQSKWRPCPFPYISRSLNSMKAAPEAIICLLQETFMVTPELVLVCTLS